MSISSIQAYASCILTHVPWTHWAVMGALALALTVLLLIRKRCSLWGAICLGMAAFVGLALLDTAVVIRYLGLIQHGSGSNVGFTFDRLFHGSEAGRSEVISNVAVFVPFGFFLAGYLGAASAKRGGRRRYGRRRFGPWRQLLIATLAALGLSLCIEAMQIVLRVGYFEVMDLVLNTAGGFVGAGLMVAGLIVCSRVRKE